MRAGSRIFMACIQAAGFDTSASRREGHHAGRS